MEEWKEEARAEEEEWMQWMETLIPSSVSKRSFLLKPNSFPRRNFLLKLKQFEYERLNEMQMDEMQTDERNEMQMDERNAEDERLLRVVEKWVESGSGWWVSKEVNQEVLLIENKNVEKMVVRRSICGHFFPP